MLEEPEWEAHLQHLLNYHMEGELAEDQIKELVLNLVAPSEDEPKDPLPLAA